MQVTGDRCLVIDSRAGGVILVEEHCLVAGDRERERAVGKCAPDSTGLVEAREIVSVPGKPLAGRLAAGPKFGNGVLG